MESSSFLVGQDDEVQEINQQRKIREFKTNTRWVNTTTKTQVIPKGNMKKTQVTSKKCQHKKMYMQYSIHNRVPRDWTKPIKPLPT